MAIDWDANVVAPLVAVFGEPVNYRPAIGLAFDITAVFDSGYREVIVLDDGAADTSARPVLGVRLADFAVAPLQSDTLYVTSADATYVVAEVRPDSHGHALLMLNKVRAGA